MTTQFLCPPLDFHAAAWTPARLTNLLSIVTADMQNVVTGGSRQLTAVSNHRFDLATNPDADTGDAWVSAWVYQDSQANYNTIFFTGASSDGEDGLWVAAESSGKVFVAFNDSVQATRVTVTSTASMSTGEWNHVAVRFDRSGNIDIWINGTQDATTGDISGHSATLGATDGIVGATPGPANEFDGRLAFVSYGEGAILSSADIAWLSSKPRNYEAIKGHGGTPYTSLVHHYNGNEASGAILDSHGSNDGTDTVGSIGSAAGPVRDVIDDETGNYDATPTNYTAAELLAAYKTDTPHNHFTVTCTDGGSGGNDGTMMSFADVDAARVANTAHGTFSSVIHDGSGNSKHARMSGWASIAGGRSEDVPSAIGSGYSLVFDGTDDELVCGNIGNVTSVSFYVKSVVDNQELFTLQDSTATAVTVSGGTLTFGGSLSASNIEVDSVSKSAAEAGALINDNTWHLVTFDLTSVAGSDLRLGTDSSAYGNVMFDNVTFTGAGGDLASYTFDETRNLPAVAGGRAIKFAPSLSTYIDVGDVSALQFTGNFAVGCLFRTTEAASSIALFSKDAGAGTNRCYRAYLDASGNITFQIWISDVVKQVVGTTVNNDGEWHYLLCVNDGTSLLIYVDGLLDSSDTVGGTPDNDAADFRIGILENDALPWNGDIDEVRAYNATKTAAQAYSLATGADDTTNLVGYWSFDDAQNSVPNVQEGMSFEFDGVDQHQTYGAISLTGEFSLTAWVKPDDFSGAAYIFGSTADANSDGLRIDNSTGKISTVIGGNADILSTSGLTAGQYNHVVVTRDASDNLSVIINGTDDTSGTPSQSGTLTLNAIGCTHSTPANFLDGNLDDARVYSRELSGAEATNLDDGIDPSTTNLVAHWSFDDGVDSEVADGDPILSLLTKTNRYQFLQETAIHRPAWDALDADLGDKPALAFDSNDLLVHTGGLVSEIQTTQGCWSVGIKTPSSFSGDHTICSASDTDAANNYTRLAIDSSGKLFFEANDGGTVHKVTGNTVLSASTAYVVTVTSDGATWRLWVNGAEQTLTVTTSNSGKMPGDISSLDNVGLGGLKHTSKADHFGGSIHSLYLVGSLPLPADRDNLEEYIANQIGVAL